MSLSPLPSGHRPHHESSWRRPVLLVNAGSRSGAVEVEAAHETLQMLGLSLVAWEMVEGDGLQDRLRFWMEDGADLIIVGGGDGTLRIAAEELQGSDVTLGILPLGTGNNLARDLRLPLTLPEACRAIMEGRVSPIELGLAEFEGGERRVFINAAHVGLFGMANVALDPALKRRYGHFAYAIGAWRAYREFSPFRLRMTAGDDTRIWTAIQVSAVLGEVYAGGVGQIPGETLGDRRMTLTVLEQDGMLRWLSLGWQLARSRSARPARAHRFWLKKAHLSTGPPQDVNLDGEILGQTPVTFRVQPHALKVIASADAPLPSPSPWKPWVVAGGVAAGLVAGVLVGRKIADRRNKPDT